MLPWLLAGALAALIATPTAAADTATGTFTVGGKTVRLAEVYATFERDPAQDDQLYLMLLVADVPVAMADRTPDRLLALAKAGALHALRIRLTRDADNITVIPYHQDIAGSGRAFQQFATINLSRFNDSRVDAAFKSKMLGQTWQFSAVVKAAITKGGTAWLEPDADVPADSPTPGGPDATALKRQLGSMGYEFTPESFFQAIRQNDLSAIELFLQAGMSPNARNDQGRYALNHAVLGCAGDSERASAVIVLLVRANGNVSTRDPDNQTTPLVGAVQSCSIEAIDALIKAGSDLSAKSAGGKTALQLANIFQRPDVAELLRTAGAK